MFKENLKQFTLDISSIFSILNDYNFKTEPNKNTEVSMLPKIQDFFFYLKEFITA